MMNTNTKPRKSGFTLIEILVVLGIVVILAALLFGVFWRVRESGRQTVCQSNMKQIALAIQQYVGDNGGCYPLNIYSPNKKAPPVWWHDAISPYIKSTDVFLCPTKNGDTEVVKNYMYNFTHLNVYAPPLPSKDVKGIQEASLTNTTTLTLLGETSWRDAEGNYSYGGPELKSSCGRSSAQVTLHSGGANYAFVDGHVKWLAPQQAAEMECSNGPLPFPFKN